ncbi:hypothetical protein D1AOALGA4SA_8907 [Olavius algarvensis Delta 1 endosymbiont]|nr:hypothetical protein D1AOALGA4SA_8907 [Olavius algarvensis Delta 1 endosymbiont]
MHFFIICEIRTGINKHYFQCMFTNYRFSDILCQPLSKLKLY